MLGSHPAGFWKVMAWEFLSVGLPGPCFSSPILHSLGKDHYPTGITGLGPIQEPGSLAFIIILMVIVGLYRVGEGCVEAQKIHVCLVYSIYEGICITKGPSQV